MVCDNLFCDGSKRKKSRKKHVVFISLPMSGRTNAEILHDIYQAKEWYLLSQRKPIEDVAFLTNFGAEFIQRPETKKELEAVWFLGAAIQKMAQCDEVLFWGQWGTARGCLIEREVAIKYHMPVTYGSDWTEEPNGSDEDGDGFIHFSHVLDAWTDWHSPDWERRTRVFFNSAEEDDLK